MKDHGGYPDPLMVRRVKLILALGRKGLLVSDQDQPLIRPLKARLPVRERVPSLQQHRLDAARIRTGLALPLRVRQSDLWPGARLEARRLAGEDLPSVRGSAFALEQWSSRTLRRPWPLVADHRPSPPTHPMGQSHRRHFVSSFLS